MKILMAAAYILLVVNIAKAQQPTLKIPIGHTADINTASFSPDGKYIVTSSDDFTARVWEKASGRLLYSLDGHKKEISSAIFSPDGSRIITISINDTARIWDAKTGALINVLNDKAGINPRVAYSTDGKYILSVGFLAEYDPLTANLWDANSGKLIYKFEHSKNVTAAKFSTDGKKIITSSNDNTVKIWKVLTGTLLADLKGHTDEVMNVSFSDDGKLALTVSKDKTAKVWNADNGILITTIKEKYALSLGCFSPDGKTIVTVPDYPEITLGKGSMKAWDAQTGRLLFEFKKHKNEITDILFIENGDKLLSASYDATAIIWNAATGKPINELKGHDSGIMDIAISPDGKTILTASSDFTAKLWDAKTYQSLLTLEGYTYAAINSEFSADGQKILTASDGAYVRLWDPGQGKLIYTFKAGQGKLNGAHFSQNEKKILVASCNVAEIWDAATGNLLSQFNGFNSCVESVEMSPDSQKILTTSFWNAVPKIWDIKTKSVLQLKGHESKYGADIAHYSPDGKLVLTAATGPVSDKTARIWDAATGKTLQILTGHNFEIRRAIFFPDASKVITAAADNTVKIWDVGSGKLLYQLDGFTQYMNSINFSPDGQKILIASGDNLARVWDTPSGKLLYELKGHNESVTNALFFPDGKSILTASADATVRIWDAATGALLRTIDLGNNTIFEKISFQQEIFMAIRRSEMIIFNLRTGKEMYSLIPIKEKDFIIKNMAGYYLATPDASKLLHYVTANLKIISFEQLDVKYNRPDKILEATGSTDTALIKSYRKAWEKRTKKLGIDTTAFRDGYSIPESDFANRDAIEYEQKTGILTLHIKGLDTAYKLDRFNVWVNEVPVYGQRGISIRRRNKNDFDTTITIKLSQGENRIETSITNVNGTESYRMPFIVNYTPVVNQKEMTHFIGIGIDEFADNQYNLQYSAKDIRDLSKKLKEKYGDGVIIDTLFNDNVTVSNVKALKKKLQQTTENDKVIIAYSGHGMLSKDFDYYLSTYSVNFEKPEQNGLPYDDLESLLDSIPARKKLMLIDACHSGEVDKEDLITLNNTPDSLIKGLKPVGYKQEGHLGLKNSFELMQSLFVNVGKSTGATIISAAAGTQFALERNDLKNGVFTYSILEAMKTNATMKISELKTIVGKRVEELTNGLQKPTSRNETIVVDWNVW